MAIRYRGCYLTIPISISTWYLIVMQIYLVHQKASHVRLHNFTKSVKNYMNPTTTRLGELEINLADARHFTKWKDYDDSKP